MVVGVRVAFVSSCLYFTLASSRCNRAPGLAIVFALASLILIHFVIVSVIYHRIIVWVPFGIGAFILGTIACSIWWLKTGHFQLEGALGVLTAVIATVLVDRIGASRLWWSAILSSRYYEKNS